MERMMVSDLARKQSVTGCGQGPRRAGPGKTDRTVGHLPVEVKRFSCRQREPADPARRPENTAIPNRSGTWNWGFGVPESDHMAY